MSYSIPTVQVSAREVLTLVVFPSLPEPAVQRALVACLISTLSARPVSHLSAVEVVLNLLNIAIPEMAGVIRDLSTVNLRTAQMTLAAARLWAGVDDAGANPVPNLPFATPGPPNPIALAVTEEAPVYAGVAAILFAIGRQATESAQTAALDKRPDALIRRFGIADGDRVLLPGREAGPTRESLERIYDAFATYTEIRAEITRFFIGIKRSMSHYPLHIEVLITNFNLMRGAGMTHVDAILRLARSHPWTIHVPELTPYYRHFVEELQLFQGIDEDVRPYHRLLVSQSDFLFVSAEYRPLIAVAGSLIAEVEKTFKGYVYNESSYSALVEKVKEYAPQYASTQKLTSLAQLLDIPDVPLPDRPAKPQAPQAPIV